MGREIRRVPPDWEHPVYTADDTRDPDRLGKTKPLYDNDYQSVAEEWISHFEAHRRGEPISAWSAKYAYYWEYDSPPDKEYYRARKWTEEEATHYQMYETVSEGTPLTPVFATKEELVQHLISHGTAWDRHPWSETAARAFVEDEYAPSMVVVSGGPNAGIYMPEDGRPPAGP